MFKINNSGVFIVNFEHISHPYSSVSIFDFVQLNAGCLSATNKQNKSF